METARFAVIALDDTILFDSNDLNEAFDAYELFRDGCYGVFDYLQNRYIDIVDAIDITGVQFCSLN